MHMSMPDLDWQVAESDAEWERLASPPAAVETPAAPALRLRRSARRAVALLLLMASAGGWGWCPGTATLPPPAARVRATAQAELAVSAQHDDDLAAGSLADRNDRASWEPNDRRVSGLKAAVQAADAKPRPAIEFQGVEFQGDQAVVSIVTKDNSGRAPYRQTRFYQRIGPDWRQMTPDAALWGPARSLETPFLVYHFRQYDAPAVNAVLAEMDTLYNTMRRNVGLPNTRLVGQPFALIGEKLVIEVSVTHSPGNVRYQPQNDERFTRADRLVVTSPAVYLAPVELTDAALLAQSIALPLLDQVLAQATEHHAIGEAWQPMVNGLRLWQVWDLDLPLATWREEVVQWLYVHGPAVSPGQPFVLPDNYAALCDAHKLWLPSPTQLNLPLICGRAEPEWEEQSFPLWRLLDPLTRLDQFAVPWRPGEHIEEPYSLYRAIHPGQTVALATLIEYAVATYGRERLPALLAGLGRHKSWETLIPAVYGVSARKFEQGWQAYLAVQYGVSLDTVRQK